MMIKDKIIALRVTAPVHSKLSKLAKSKGKTITALICESLDAVPDVERIMRAGQDKRSRARRQAEAV